MIAPKFAIFYTCKCIFVGGHAAQLCKCIPYEGGGMRLLVGLTPLSHTVGSSLSPPPLPEKIAKKSVQLIHLNGEIDSTSF